MDILVFAFMSLTTSLASAMVNERAAPDTNASVASVYRLRALFRSSSKADLRYSSSILRYSSIAAILSCATANACRGVLKRLWAPPAARRFVSLSFASFMCTYMYVGIFVLLAPICTFFSKSGSIEIPKCVSRANYMCVCIYICMYIYIYVYRFRDQLELPNVIVIVLC